MLGVKIGGLSDNQVVMIVSSVVLFGVTFYYNKRRNRNPPKEWRDVGHIANIMCYPIKSCGGIRLNEVECAQLGLKVNMLRDRVFMVVDQNGSFITGRVIPKLTQVYPSIEGSLLTLKGSGMPDISIDIDSLYNCSTSRTKVWGQDVNTVDCGDDVANWLAQFLLLGEERVVRLVYYPTSTPTRSVRKNNQVFSNLTSKDSGALTDATSYNLITLSSLADLNYFVKDRIPKETFRANFIAQGTVPYDEDNWNWVRIGSSMFQNVKPCTRCQFTLVNPETGVKRLDHEPLKTLKTYRQITDPEIVPSVGNSPVFGIHLALRTEGKVAVGDRIYVG